MACGNGKFGSKKSNDNTKKSNGSGKTNFNFDQTNSLSKKKKK